MRVLISSIMALNRPAMMTVSLDIRALWGIRTDRSPLAARCIAEVTVSTDRVSSRTVMLMAAMSTSPESSMTEIMKRSWLPSCA